MRKIKKINGYLVVRFNSREKREYETLGTYGVIDAELYTGDIDIDRGAMEYDEADTLEVALEQARGLESELEVEEPAASYTIVKETDGATYEYEIADPQVLMGEWEAELASQIRNRRYTDMDPHAAAHERYGFLVALERLGLIEDAGCFSVPDTFQPLMGENFAHAPQDAPTRQIYALGLALQQECPQNDCMVFRNTFAMCLDLDEQIDRVTGLARCTLEAELFKHQHRLFQMYLNNYATWTGHDFLGWYLSSSYEGEAVTEVSATDIWSGTREYFAKWQESGFKVTYEGLNGATNTNPQSYTYHESATITLADPGKREGYTFAGWYNGATQVTAIDRSVMEDITLTAKWTLVQYNITYYGASGHNGVKTYTIEDEVTLTDYVPSSGGTFLGWMTGEYANDPVKGRKIPKGSTGDKIFYVKVLAATGKMFYVMNDGFWDTYTPTPSATRGSEAFLLAEPVRSGFKFYGWYTNPEFTGDPIYSIPASNTDGNKSYVLYARWIANTEVITITDLSQLSQYEGTASKGKYIVIEAPTGNGLATTQASGTLLTNFYGVIEGAVTGDTTAYLKIESKGATFIKNNYGAVRQIAFIGQYGTSSTSEISGPIVNNHGLVLDCAVNPHYGGYKEACKVYGGEVAGGIVGYNRTTGVVASCNNNAVDIGASEARGGVVGKNDGYVYDCTASINVGVIPGTPFEGVAEGNIIGINTANGIYQECKNNPNLTPPLTGGIVGRDDAK